MYILTANVNVNWLNKMFKCECECDCEDDCEGDCEICDCECVIVKMIVIVNVLL